MKVNFVACTILNIVTGVILHFPKSTNYHFTTDIINLPYRYKYCILHYQPNYCTHKHTYPMMVESSAMAEDQNKLPSTRSQKQILLNVLQGAQLLLSVFFVFLRHPEFSRDLPAERTSLSYSVWCISYVLWLIYGKFLQDALNFQLYLLYTVVGCGIITIVYCKALDLSGDQWLVSGHLLALWASEGVSVKYFQARKSGSRDRKYKTSANTAVVGGVKKADVNTSTGLAKTVIDTTKSAGDIEKDVILQCVGPEGGEKE